jgi:hypothetical protein
MLIFIHIVMFRFTFHATTVPDYVRLNRSFVNDAIDGCARWTTAHPQVTQGPGHWVTFAEVKLS